MHRVRFSYEHHERRLTNWAHDCAFAGRKMPALCCMLGPSRALWGHAVCNLIDTVRAQVSSGGRYSGLAQSWGIFHLLLRNCGVGVLGG
jgi:hypothetical protein